MSKSGSYVLESIPLLEASSILIQLHYTR